MTLGGRLRIWTHSGRAHLDELVGIALLIIKWAIECGDSVKDLNPENIEINRVSSSELPDHLGPNDYIVDTGLKYDGAHKFDHHQMTEQICAAHLVARKFFPELLEDYQWSAVIHAMDTIDCQGMHAYELKHGVKAHPLLAHAWLFTDLFKEDPLYAALAYARGLETKIRYLRVDVPEAITWVKNHQKIMRVELSSGSFINAVVFYKDFRLDHIDASAYTSAERAFCREWGVRVICGWDHQSDPGTVRSVYRVANRDGLLNFNKCKSEKITFASEIKACFPDKSMDWKAVVREAAI